MARAAIDNIKKLNPDFLKAPQKAMVSWNFSQELMDHALEGLSKAGLDIPEKVVASESPV